MRKAVSRQPSAISHHSMNQQPTESGDRVGSSPANGYRPLATGASDGFSMIELVSALALFVVIFGILLIALNTATNLWGDARARHREQPSAQRIADLIADDLDQAVADISGDASLYKSFYLYSPASASINPHAVTFYLALLRPASRHTLIPQADWPTDGDRLSLDAVYYTGYSNALFRIVLPLFQDLASSTSNGIPTREQELLPSAPPLLNNAAFFDHLLASEDLPSVSATLLAKRVIPTFLATYLDDSDPHPDDVQSDRLPHVVDCSLHLFNTEDWATYQSLINDTSDEAAVKRTRLGTLISRRITLPQAGGSRLP